MKKSNNINHNNKAEISILNNKSTIGKSLQSTINTKTPFDKITIDNPLITAIIEKAKSNCCRATWDRISKILQYIITERKDKLKQECYNGLPDDLPVLRSLIWKINFRYLHYPIEKWGIVLDKKRKEYEDIKDAFILKLMAEKELLEEVETANSSLSESTTTSKNKADLFLLAKNTDRELLEAIDKDISRTHSNFDFFFKPSTKEDNDKVNIEELNNFITNKQNCTYSDYKTVYSLQHNQSYQTHFDILGRILYVYSKLNKDVSYVQGMNEILAPIYYCYASESSLSGVIINVEADTFWSFAILMDDIKPIFIKEKDKEKNGIFGHMSIFQKIIEKYDIELYKKLIQSDGSLFYISFKWFSLFFSQDLFMSDILRLWDIIFCERNRFSFVYYFALGILKSKKELIVKQDYLGIMKSLQTIEYNDINDLIDISIKIKKENNKKIKKLIASIEKTSN